MYFTLLVCLTITWMNSAYGQFVYFSVGASMSSQKFTSESKYTLYGNEYPYEANFHLKTTSLDLGVFWRPLRIIGIGFQAGFPISGSSRGDIITGAAAGAYNRWTVQQNEYDLSTGITVRGHVRFFVERKVNLYGDLSISLTTMSERFILSRPYAAGEYFGTTVLYPELDAINIDDSRDYNIMTPGIQLGVMPNLAKHIFLDFHVRLNMITHPVSSMRYDIVGAWDWNNEVSVVNPAVSPLKGETFWATTLGLSLGYYF